MANTIDNMNLAGKAWFKMDEASGNAIDSKSNLTATLVGGVARVTGWNGQGNALSFDGVDDYATIPISLTGAISIRFKFKKSSPPASTEQYVMSTLNYYAGQTGMGVYVVSNGRIVFQFSRNGTISCSIASVKNVCDNQWHDICFTWNGVAGTGNAKVYIDDMVTPNYSNNGILSNDLAHFSSTLYLARLVPSSTFWGSFQMDELEIYSSVISPIPDKTLVLNDGVYKYYTTSWQNIGASVTDANYKNQGMSDISIVPQSAWSQLSGDVELSYWTDATNKSSVRFDIETNDFTLKDEFKGKTVEILYYTDDVNKTSQTIGITANYSPLDDLNDPQLLTYAFGYDSTLTKDIKVTATPKPKLVIPVSDIDIKGVSQGFILSANQTGNGTIRVVISTDQGATWKYYRNSSLQTISISDLASIKLNGMTVSELNSITPQQWGTISPSGKVRIAYYLEQRYTSDVVQIENLKSNENVYLTTPKISNINVVYDAYDEKYYGILFMDTSENYYSTSLGEILKYLDFGTIISGQTTMDIKVLMQNSLPFQVQNIVIEDNNDVSSTRVEFSKTRDPFIAQSSLLFDQIVNPDDVIEFYIRLSIDKNAEPHDGVFNLLSKADPV